MPCCDTKETYGFMTRFFHWLIFLLVTGQLLLGVLMDDISNEAWRVNAYVIHKSSGLVILLVAALFLAWRWFNRRPAFPESMSKWERIAANLVHTLLYWLLILMPLTGWAMATAAGHAPNFFWLYKIPLPLIPHNRAFASTAGVMHGVFAWMISVTIVIHILAALKHFFIDKDRVLQRMLRGR